MSKTTDYLERKEVSTYLRSRGIRLSYRTLVNLARGDNGPKYELFTPTKALYTKADVDAWIEERFRKNRKPADQVGGSAAG